jgi:mono/diheme cytochrome c family protein
MRRVTVILLAALACLISSAQAEVSLNKEIQPILDKNCVDCHNPKKPKAGLDLSPANAYASMVQVPSKQVPSTMLVKPGEPDQSYLWQKLNHTTKEGSGMPKTFFGSKKLPDADLNAVKAWIQGGAKK